ncbi:hypothetical protein GYMLUDRAFT_262350 [Collybiopsis luxurians FD-317 M1]|uniref:Uncharacterized protein n=1 Tax=Collybiopsis luxurians FD-317 M1 TaxID=944289 RepID=A0A0D0B5Z2_9AGAR|nr:hypothetical protein GYMLUDRAFT_262350 [Collybiopsis luxurians FD-317 M1]
MSLSITLRSTVMFSSRLNYCRTPAGVFIVLFALSIYIFRQKFIPGKFYIIATILFFALATSSVALDLVQRFSLPLETALHVSNSANSAGKEGGVISAINDLVSRLLADVELANTPLLLNLELKSTSHCSPDSSISRKLCYVLLDDDGKFGRDTKPSPLLIVWLGFMVKENDIETYHNIYVISGVAQNNVLTLLIVGRMWWYNYTMKNIFHGQPDRGSNINLLWPVLISGCCSQPCSSL